MHLLFVSVLTALLTLFALILILRIILVAINFVLLVTLISIWPFYFFILACHFAFSLCVIIFFLKEANFQDWKYRTPRYWPIGFWASRKDKWKRRLRQWLLRPASINHWYVGIQFACAQMEKAQHRRLYAMQKLAKIELSESKRLQVQKWI